MMIYLMLGLLCFNAYFNYRKGQKQISTFIICLIVLFVGLQNYFTSDYTSYLNHFSEINNFHNVFTSIYEIGFDLLLLLAKKINFGFQTVLLIIAGISIFLKYYVINKISLWPSVSFIVYFIYFFVYNDISQIRHGLAIALCFSAILFLKRKKIISLLLIILASSFHTSALFFIPVLIVDNIKVNKKTILLFCFMTMIFSFFNIYNLIFYLNNTFFHSSYITFKLNSYGVESVFPFMQFGFWFRIIFAAYFAKTSLNTDDDNQLRFFKIYLLGILIYCMTASITILQSRVSVYYMYMLLPMIGEVFNNIYMKKRRFTFFYSIHFILINKIYLISKWKLFYLSINLT